MHQCTQTPQPRLLQVFVGGLLQWFAVTASNPTGHQGCASGALHIALHIALPRLMASMHLTEGFVRCGSAAVSEGEGFVGTEGAWPGGGSALMMQFAIMSSCHGGTVELVVAFQICWSSDHPSRA